MSSKISSNENDSFIQLNSDKSNVPIKQRFDLHLKMFLINLFQILICYLLFGEYFIGQSKMENFQNTTDNQIDNFIFISIYVISVVIVYYLSDMRNYIRNFKNIQKIKQDFQKFKKSRIYFQFFIECYHFKHNSETTQKQISFTNRKKINLDQCYDISGFLKFQIQNKHKKYPFLFVKFLPVYQFIDQNQKGLLENLFNNFIIYNKIDQYQQHNNNVKLQGISEYQYEQGYLINGSKSRLKLILLFASATFIIWPITLLLENFYINKFTVKIQKKIRINKNQCQKKFDQKNVDILNAIKQNQNIHKIQQ